MSSHHSFTNCQTIHPFLHHHPISSTAFWPFVSLSTLRYHLDRGLCCVHDDNVNVDVQFLHDTMIQWIAWIQDVILPKVATIHPATLSIFRSKWQWYVSTEIEIEVILLMINAFIGITVWSFTSCEDNSAAWMKQKLIPYYSSVFDWFVSKILTCCFCAAVSFALVWCYVWAGRSRKKFSKITYTLVCHDIMFKGRLP